MSKKPKTYQPTRADGSKAVPFSVTMPVKMVKQIDAAAKTEGISRSFWINKAVIAALSKTASKKAAAKNGKGG